MSHSLVQSFGASRRPETIDRLDRAIAWADFTAACLRCALPVLTVLGVTDDRARRALLDAERRAEVLRDRRDLLAFAVTRGGRAN